MSVLGNTSGQIILLVNEIENNIDKFKTSIEYFFSDLIENHHCIYDISLDIDGDNILKYSCYTSTQDEVIKLINDKFSYLLNNDKRLLEIVKKLENKKINFSIEYNLVGFEFLNLLATLYNYHKSFEAKAQKSADGESPSIFSCNDGEIDYGSCENTNKFKDGYIEKIAVYSRDGMLGFYNSDILKITNSLENSGKTLGEDAIKTCDLAPLQDKIEKAKELLDSLDIDGFGYDYYLESPWEGVMELNSFTLEKHNKKKFISTITEIVNMFDLEKDQFYITLNFEGEYENYLESYVIENGEFKVKHLKAEFK